MVKIGAFVAVAVLAASSGFAMATPETSKLFVDWTDPHSGVRSRMLKPGVWSENQQSTYFIMKCMSDDGRFMLFLPSKKEGSDGVATRGKIAFVDFEKDEIREIGTFRGSFFFDTRLCKVWTAHKDDGFSVYDLTDPQLRRRYLGPIPRAITSRGEIKSLCGHLTLSQDRRRAFLDTHVKTHKRGLFGEKEGDDVWMRGMAEMETGRYVHWGDADFPCEHGQLNPANDGLAMCCWEWSWVGKGLEFKRTTGWDPRMWFLWSDGRVQLQPPVACNEAATHESWTRDGRGHYWCSKPFGVWYQDLETRQQTCLSPFYAEHGNVTDDRNYVLFDERPCGWWRGSSQRVGFYNRLTKRHTWIYSTSAPLCSSESQSKLHPDGHPQFTCNDKYAVCSLCEADGHIDLLVTPVAELIAKTSVPRPGEAAFSDWPAGKGPVAVGKLLSDLFLSRTPEEWTSEHIGRARAKKALSYPTVCTFYGMLQFMDELNDRKVASDLWRRVAERNPFVEKELLKHAPPCDHVDNNMFGCLPLALYRVTGWKCFLDKGLEMADAQWRRPEKDDKVSEGVPGMFEFEKRLELWNQGYTQQTRLWMDDMFMITIIQLEAYKATGDRKYADRASREMLLYLDKLQNPDGLFYHGPGAPYVWGRGNGWMAAGMAMLLKNLPLDDANKPRILEGYRKMMAALLKHQRPDGMWGQLVDDPEIWPETSGSAMFAYAFIEGVKHGWLDEKTYAPAARKAFLALTGFIEPDGSVRDVCCGTNVGSDRDHYAKRPRVLGDLHGQAPVLWCCAALADYLNP